MVKGDAFYPLSEVRVMSSLWLPHLQDLVMDTTKYNINATTVVIRTNITTYLNVNVKITSNI